MRLIEKCSESIKVLNDYRNLYHAESSSTEQYIERDALIDHFKNCIDEVKNANGCTDDFEICLKAVQNQPTIDAEPVVRCKDCRYREYIAGRMFCSKVYSLRVEENHYCGYGAKMDEEAGRNDL